MNVRRAAAVTLGFLGVTAAVSLTGGVMAAGTVEVVDVTRIVVGAGDAAGMCDDSLTVQAGLARFDASSRAFLIRDVTVSDVNANCGGLFATVVGMNTEGAVVVEGSAISAANTFTVNLSNVIAPSSVSEWHVALQGVSGDVVDAVTPPAINPDPAIVVPGDVEPLPEPTPTPTPSPTPVVDTPDEVLPEPTPSPSPSTELELDDPEAELEPTLEPEETSLDQN
jgi:hypothetical protein